MLRTLLTMVITLTCYLASEMPVFAQDSTVQTPQPQTTINSQGGAGTTPTTPGTSNPSSAPSQIITQPDGSQVTVQTLYCPQPSELIKNGLFWGTATGGWKSYSESFDQSITSFIGAQWAGVNVGKMICIYKGNLKLSFQITIQNDTLAQTPSGALWGKDLGGYRNCHSTNVTDCPFIVKTPVVNFEQIYKSLDFYKGKPSPLN